jgi:dephospho-CoA kinase
MIHVALTGGIGSGKSLIGNIFTVLGAQVFQADTLAKDLYAKPAWLKKIKNNFGAKVVVNGTLDRKALADIVFADPQALKKLNAMVHPEVMRIYYEAVEKQPEHRVCLLETAIVFEAGLESHFDQIVSVYAPEELCIKRILQRDNSNREAVLQRMSHQWKPEIKAEKSDIVILNDDSKLVIPQVISCYKQLITLLK